MTVRHLSRPFALADFDRNITPAMFSRLLSSSTVTEARNREERFYANFSPNRVRSRFTPQFSNPPNGGTRARRMERKERRPAKMRENKGRKKKRDRRSEEEESRYHNIAVIPGSVSFQIIQKPADRTYIPGPTRSSYRVIIVEGPNRP